MRLRHLILLVCLIPLLLAGDRWGRDQLPAFGRGEWGRGDITAEEWLPSDITGVQYWWRADQGITYGSTAPACTSWTDIIAGKIAYAGAAASEPAWKTGADGINGMPVVQGDGNDDYLLTANFGTAIEQPFTVWCVATVPVDNNATRIAMGFGASRALSWDYAAGSDKYAVAFGVTVTNTALSPAGTVEFHLLIMGTTDNLWVNGINVVTGNAGTNNAIYISITSLYVGYRAASKYAEVGFILGTISAADQALLEAYVEDRYGVVIAYLDGFRTTILCMNDMNMTDEMMMFLTLYNPIFYQGRSEW